MSEEDYRVHFPENKKFFSFYTLKKALKILFAVMIISLFGVVIVRNITMKGSGEMRAYFWTEDAVAAAQQEEFQIYEVATVHSPQVDDIMMLSGIYRTEPIEQLQFLLSYNKNNLKELGADNKDLFAFVLVDSEGNRYTEYEYLTDELLLNGFFRLIFSDVKMTQSTVIGSIPVGPEDDPQTEQITAKVPIETFRICIYYGETIDLDAKPMAEMTVYEYGHYQEKVSPKIPSEPGKDLQSADAIDRTVKDGSKEAEYEE